MADRGTPDRIAIRGLRAHAHHGVYKREREQGQLFLVDAVTEVDTRPSAAGDDLELTVDYAELAKKLHSALVHEPVDLLETLAQRLADVCLADPLVDAVEITVHKPDADLGVPFSDVTVTIHREKVEGPASSHGSHARRGPLRRAGEPVPEHTDD